MFEIRKRVLLTAVLLLGVLISPMALMSAETGTSASQSQAIQSIYVEGVQAYRAGDYRKAVKLFRDVLATDAANVNGHYYLALSLDYLHQGPEAAGEYQYVAKHGHEAAILEYAKKRLNALQSSSTTASSPVPSTTTVSRANATSSVAMVAAGTEIVPAVYRGSVTRVAVPLKNSRNALMVDATLRSNQVQTSGTFIIDTGATYTSISQEMAESLGLDLVHCETVRITTANGRIDVPKVMIDTLNVNGLEAHNVEATVIPVRHGSSFSGLIGLSFIRQFVLTIDPQGGQLIFQKN